jgi:hypothetical protein
MKTNPFTTLLYDQSIMRAMFQIKKWRPVDMSRIESLSLPTVRDVLEPRDLKVSPEALTYQITKRIEKLAERRELPVIEPRIIAVSPSALKAVGNIHAIVTIWSLLSALPCFHLPISRVMGHY